MRIFPILLVALVLFVAVPVDQVNGFSQEEPEALQDTVIVETYKKVSSTHLVVTGTTKSSYENVVVYVFTDQPVKVTVNGSEICSFTPATVGDKLLLHFDEGDTVDMRVSLGSSNYDYSFKVRKTISIKELDPEEDEESRLYGSGEVVVFCIIVFLSASLGVYAMYRLFKRKSMREVRLIGSER